MQLVLCCDRLLSAYPVEAWLVSGWFQVIQRRAGSTQLQPAASLYRSSRRQIHGAVTRVQLESHYSE